LESEAEVAGLRLLPDLGGGKSVEGAMEGVEK